MRTTRFKILLSRALRQSPNQPKHLLVVIPQPRLGIDVRRRQPRDIAVPLRVRQRRRRLDVGVRNTRARAASGTTAVGTKALFENQLRQAARGLREVRVVVVVVAAAVAGGGRRGAAGREAVIVAAAPASRRPRWRGCGAGFLLLRGRQGRGLAAGGVAEDGLDVLVAALVGFPGRVAEALMDGMDVELVEEGLVG